MPVERCLQLQLVDLSRTEIEGNHELCICSLVFVTLRTLKLPGKLRKIQQEAFLKCTSLKRMVHVPPTNYCYRIARRAFGGQHAT